MGTTFGLANSANSATYVRDSSDYSTLLLNNDVGVTMSLSPHFGVYCFALAPRRGERSCADSSSINESIQTTLPNGVQSSAVKKQVHDDMPWRAGLGVEADVVRGVRNG